MGFLTDGANKAFSSASRRAYVPQWYRSGAVYVGLGAGAVLLLGSAIIGGGGDDTTEAAPGPTSPVGIEAVPVPGAEALPTDEPSTPVETSPSSSPSSSPSTPSSGSSTGSSGSSENVLVASTSGGQVSVPADAYANAQAVTAALFSGDFSGVKLAQGATAPTVVPVVGASITGVALAEEAPSSLTFEASVSVSGVEQKIPVTLVFENGEYNWFPGI
jgi:hypothetical protein